MTNKRIFITGGTGFLGRCVVEKYYKDNKLTVMSRDESKHAVMRKEFPNINFVIGDVRNLDLLMSASRGHDIGIFCASLKHVAAVNENIEEAEAIIVQGAINARKVSIANKFQSAVMVSTDKSRYPITLYGAMKFIAGEQFIWNAESENTNLSSIICGNIINSTGSLIPMIWKSIKYNRTMSLFGPSMTRFTITGPEAADLIAQAISVTGHSVVPKLKSFSIKDVFDIYARTFGLKYEIVVSSNSLERQHESMITTEDHCRLYDYGDYYCLHYRRMNPNPPLLVNNEYNSLDHLMSMTEVEEMLAKNNYFKPE